MKTHKLTIGIIGNVGQMGSGRTVSKYRLVEIESNSQPDFDEVDVVLFDGGNRDSKLRADHLNRKLTLPRCFLQEIETGNDPEFEVQMALTRTYGFVVGWSSEMARTLKLIRAYSHPASVALGLPVLITGKTGTGKELAARALHRFTTGREGNFVAMNLGGIDAMSARSELFGHVRGAYTDAYVSREGAFKRASQGTLFLDEVGDCALSVQIQLLRALEERAVQPLGSDQSEAVDVMVVSATHRDLQQMSLAGAFRLDLLSRLDSLELNLIPLHDRIADLPLLTQFVLQRHSLSPNLIEFFDFSVMSSFSWPGNLREFRSFVLRAVVEQRTGASFLDVWTRYTANEEADSMQFAAGTLKRIREDLERRVLIARLQKLNFDTELVAKSLGISRKTLYTLAKKLGVATNAKDQKQT